MKRPKHGGRAAEQAKLGRRFYLLFSAYTISDAGTSMYTLTLPLLVLHLTGSALQTAALYALQYVPFLLTSLPGGVLADRFDRKKLLVVGDLTAGMLAIIPAVLVSSGVTALLPIYLAAFLLACVEPIYYPAFQSILPTVVPDEGLARGNSMLQSSDNILSLLGPVLAGTMVSVFGYEAAIYVNAASFVGSALIISVIRTKKSQTAPLDSISFPSPASQRPGFTRELRDGLRYIAKENRTLLAGSLLFTGTNFGIWLIQGNLVYYLTYYLKLPATLVGVVYAAQGIGALAGAALAPAVIRWLGNGRAIVLSTITAGLLTLLLFVFRNPIGISIVFAAVYACGSVNVVSWFTLRQRIIPKELMGRIVAITRMVAYASIPAAALVAGGLEAATHKIFLIIVLGAAIRAGAGIIGLRTSLMQNNRADANTVIAEAAAQNDTSA
jgi:MFS family permease